MQRAAIFVDAGYVFAQGSVALSGSKAPRTRVSIDAEEVRRQLLFALTTAAPGRELLRIYWYDGMLPSRGPTGDHDKIADLADVKLRLGFINSAGEQKGVDSLIVTDLVDLARNGAISDALLLSGDEDVRIGVTIAQSFGVRAHLLGITPARGSQSKALMQEADTRQEWDASTVATFLTVSAAPSVVAPVAPAILPSTPSPTVKLVDDEFAAQCEALAKEMLDRTAPEDIARFAQELAANGSLAYRLDSVFLGTLKARFGRTLEDNERFVARNRFKELLRNRAT